MSPLNPQTPPVPAETTPYSTEESLHHGRFLAIAERMLMGLEIPKNEIARQAPTLAEQLQTLFSRERKVIAAQRSQEMAVMPYADLLTLHQQMDESALEIATNSLAVELESRMTQQA